MVRVLRVFRREHPLDELSQEAHDLLDTRILLSSWYPLRLLHEMHQALYDHLLGRDPEMARQAGLIAGKEIWSSAHRVYMRQSAIDNLLAMRHTWPNYFDFGHLEVEARSDRSVDFRIEGYEDMSECHGMMITGWHLAAAHLAGVEDARCDLLQRPWEGNSTLAHRIVLPAGAR